MPESWGRWLFLLVLFGVAVWAIRRAGRDLREQVAPKSRDARSELLPEEIRMIVTKGMATREQLFAMSAIEQRLLSAAARASDSTRDGQRP